MLISEGCDARKNMIQRSIVKGEKGWMDAGRAGEGAR